MNAVTIGPLVLAADRAAAVAGILAFMLVASLAARRFGGAVDRWSWVGLIGGIVAARLIHIALNWEGFASEPLRILAVWQGGFYWPAGVVVALVLILPVVPARSARVASLAALAAGLFTWHVAVTLTSGVDPVPLPDRPLEDLSRTPVTLAELGEGPVVVNLWASWCPPCRREMPMMEDVANSTPEVTFVFANQGEDAPTIRSYLSQAGLLLPNVLRDGHGALRHHYGTPGLPATLFIQADGTLADIHLGEISRERFISKLDNLRR